MGFVIAAAFSGWAAFNKAMSRLGRQLAQGSQRGSWALPLATGNMAFLSFFPFFTYWPGLLLLVGCLHSWAFLSSSSWLAVGFGLG